MKSIVTLDTSIIIAKTKNIIKSWQIKRLSRSIRKVFTLSSRKKKRRKNHIMRPNEQPFMQESTLMKIRCFSYGLRLSNPGCGCRLEAGHIPTRQSYLIAWNYPCDAKMCLFKLLIPTLNPVSLLETVSKCQAHPWRTQSQQLNSEHRQDFHVQVKPSKQKSKWKLKCWQDFEAQAHS